MTKSKDLRYQKDSQYRKERLEYQRTKYKRKTYNCDNCGLRNPIDTKCRSDGCIKLETGDTKISKNLKINL